MLLLSLGMLSNLQIDVLAVTAQTLVVPAKQKNILTAELLEIVNENKYTGQII